MLKGISNTIGSLQAASIGCAAAGLYLGKKWYVAAFHAAGRTGAKLFGSKSTEEWNQASVKSLALAKKNMFRDLTAATGLIVLSLVSGFTKEKIPQQEEPTSDFPFRTVGISLFVGYLFGGCSIFGYMHNENSSIVTNYNQILFNVLKDKK